MSFLQQIAIDGRFCQRALTRRLLQSAASVRVSPYAAALALPSRLMAGFSGRSPSL
jgi:hypothetical protein